jgi:hypothetical protein
MNLLRQDQYIQCPDFERLAEAQRLSEEMWLVAFALSGPATVADLANRCELTPSETAKAVDGLIQCGLIQRHTMTLQEFIARRNGTRQTAEPAAPAQSAATAAPTLTVLPAPEPEIPLEREETTAAPARVIAAVSTRLGRLQPVQKTEGIVFIARFGEALLPETGRLTGSCERPMAAAATSHDAMKLRPVIQAIETKGGGGISGQLLVYRVFLRVPFGSLYDEGITSLKLVDDESAVRNPDLKAAILQAAREIAGVELAA